MKSLRFTFLFLLPAPILFLAACSRQSVTVPPPIDLDNSRASAHEILERYAAAWRGEEEMVLKDTVVVAFYISGPDGGEYHVVVPPAGSTELREGAPDSFTLGFETDIDFLRRLDRSELNALTAMGQARGSDPIPMQPLFPEGFSWTAETRAFMLPFIFHFWNREWPEVVHFGEGTTRFVHGGNAAIFYYDAGLRSSWYQVKTGMHINADPRDQVNNFPTLFVITRGAIQTRLGGVEQTLSEGEAVFIPAGMSHEFWAEEDQYGEAIIVMFGEGA